MHDKSYSKMNIFEGLFIVQNKTLAFIEKKYFPILSICLQLTVLSLSESSLFVCAAVKRCS